MPIPCDSLLRGTIVAAELVPPDGAVAVAGGRILALGSVADLRTRDLPAQQLGSGRHILLPGRAGSTPTPSTPATMC